MKKMIFDGIKSLVVIILFLFMFGTSVIGLLFGWQINVYASQMEDFFQVTGIPGSIYIDWYKPEPARPSRVAYAILEED